MSSNVGVLQDEAFSLLWNVNGGAWLSGAGPVIPIWKDCALLLAKLGRRKVGRFFLQDISLVTSDIRTSYSCAFSLGGSNGESCKGLGAAGVGGSADEISTDGVFKFDSLDTANGGLCGNGDISMISIAGAGDDEGRGGVVIASSIYDKQQLGLFWDYQPRPWPGPNRVEENKDRRGVAS